MDNDRREILDEYFVKPKESFTLEDVVSIERIRKEIEPYMDTLPVHGNRVLDRVANEDETLRLEYLEIDCECACIANSKRKDLVRRARVAKEDAGLFRVRRLDESGTSEYARDPTRDAIEERIKDNQLDWSSLEN